MAIIKQTETFLKRFESIRPTSGGKGLFTIRIIQSRQYQWFKVRGVPLFPENGFISEMNTKYSCTALCDLNCILSYVKH